MSELPYHEVGLAEAQELARKKSKGNIIEASYDSQPNDVGDAFAKFLIKEGYTVVCKANDEYPSIFYEITGGPNK